MRWSLIKRDTFHVCGKRTEDDFCTFIPHFCHDCLSWVDDASQSAHPNYMSKHIKNNLITILPNFDIFVWPVGFEDMLSGNAHRAQSMKNRSIESANGCKLGKDLRFTTCVRHYMACDRCLTCKGFQSPFKL